LFSKDFIKIVIKIKDLELERIRGFMSITGTQLYKRYRDVVQLLITYQAGVQSFNIYGSTSSTGPFTLIGNVANSGSLEPQFRGKILYSFTPSLLGWNNDATNFIEVSTITGGIESVLLGPMTIPAAHDMVLDKSINVLGYNSSQDRYIDVAVDISGQMLGS
jgi:hypothetical protein